MRAPQIAPSRMHAVFAALGVAFLAIFSWVFFQEYLAEWRTTHFGRFVKVLLSRTGMSQ